MSRNTKDSIQVANVVAGGIDAAQPGKVEIFSTQSGQPGYLRLNSFIPGQSIYLFAQSNKSLRVSDTPPVNDTSGNPIVSASSGGNLSFISISCAKSGTESKGATDEISIFGTESYLADSVAFQINNSLQFSSNDYNPLTGEIFIQQHAYYLIQLNLNILAVSSNKLVIVKIISKKADESSWKTLQTYQTSLNEASSSENTLVTISELAIGTKVKATITLADTTSDIILTTGIGTSINIYSISDTAGQFVLNTMKNGDANVKLSEDNFVGYSFPTNAITTLPIAEPSTTTEYKFIIDSHPRMIFKNVMNQALHVNDTVLNGKVINSYLYPAIVNNELGLYFGQKNIVNPSQMKNENVEINLNVSPANEIRFKTHSLSIGPLFRADTLFLPNLNKTNLDHTDIDYGILSYDGSSLLLNGGSITSTAETLTDSNMTGTITVSGSGNIHTVTGNNSHAFNKNSTPLFRIDSTAINAYVKMKHSAISEFQIRPNSHNEIATYYGCLSDTKIIKFDGVIQLSKDVSNYLIGSIDIAANNPTTNVDVPLSVLCKNLKSNINVQLTLSYDGVAAAPSADHIQYVSMIDLTSNLINIKSFGTWTDASTVYPTCNFSIGVKIDT